MAWKCRLVADVPVGRDRRVVQVGGDAVLHGIGLRLPFADLARAVERDVGHSRIRDVHAVHDVAKRAFQAAFVVRRMRHRIECGARDAGVTGAEAYARRRRPGVCRRVEVVRQPGGSARAAGTDRRAPREIRLAGRRGLGLVGAEHDVVRIDLRVVVARHPMDAGVRATLFLVVVGEAHRETIGRLPKEVRAQDRVVLRAEVPGRRETLEEAVVLIRRADELRLQRIGDRQIDGDLRVAAVEVADAELHARAELVGRLFRGHVYRAAVRVAPEQRALRAAQHLDAVHLREVHLQEPEAVLPDAVDVQAYARQPAHVEVGLSSAGARIQHDVRHHDAEVATVRDAAELELLGGERLNRHGCVLQVRLAARGRDDDFFELRECGRRKPTHHRHERRRAKSYISHRIPPETTKRTRRSYTAIACGCQRRS